MPSQAELAIMIRAKDEASKVMQGVSGEVKKASNVIRDHGKEMGLAMAAVGVAGLKLVGDAKELNATLGMTAQDLGLTGEEMRNLATDTANVTFPLGEVQKSFDLLSRAGLENSNAIAMVATSFDTLGDATGRSASEVTKMLIPAFKAFKIPLQDADKHIDKFMWLTRNTTVEVSDFTRAVQYIAPDMDKLGLSIEDTVAMMAAMEAKGISGTMVTRELRTAVSQAAKGEQSLFEILNITEAELAEYTSSLAGSVGMTQEYADIANSQYGIMDKVKQQWSEISLKMGSFLEPMEGVLAGMTSLGPLMMALSTSIGQQAVKWGLNTASMIAHRVASLASIVVTKVMVVAQWALNAAMSANPIGLVIAAIAGLIAIGILLWKNWDKIIIKVKEFNKKIKDYFFDIWDTIKGWGESVIEFLKSLNPWEIMKRGWEQLREGIKGVLDKIFGSSDIEEWFAGMENYIGGQGSAMRQAGEVSFGGLRVGINDQLNQTTRDIQGAVGDWNQIAQQPMSRVGDNLAWDGWGSAEGWASTHLANVAGKPSLQTGAFQSSYERAQGIMGYAEGGIVPEPSLLYGLSSRRVYGIAGEKGKEYIGPGGKTLNITIPIMLNGREIGREILEDVASELGLQGVF